MRDPGAQAPVTAPAAGTAVTSGASELEGDWDHRGSPLHSTVGLPAEESHQEFSRFLFQPVPALAPLRAGHSRRGAVALLPGRAW